MKCPICGSAMDDAGEDLLDQCDGPNLRAHRWVCPKCEAVTLKPNPKERASCSSSEASSPA